ncbi:hypothetical protein HAX54_010708 [Datura stramonium]|uniref:Aminotransferase-like plant mobile domain-containing protein n=1 Tax=Datura stramonium TaxID=4076 RepID=A0ABS8TJG7_DATST|nr:hypothetical protein [Datura stramonium]
MIMASSNESSNNGDDGGRFNILEFDLWVPLFFVQVWAWERFLLLQPEQARNYNMVSGVKIGPWHNVKQSDVINLRTTTDSPGDTFQWRPYALAVEDCQEPYLQYRVAMQFGYAQDFPKRDSSLTFKNESSSVVPPKCNGENDKKNLSVEICQTVSCDVVPPGSMEKHTAGKRAIYLSINSEQDRNESNNNLPHKLVINKQKRGERTTCDDLITAIQVRLNRLERQAASCRR